MIQGNSWGNRVFNVVNISGMILLVIVTIYPFWYAIIGSLDTGANYLQGNIFLWPGAFTLANYRNVLGDPALLQALWVTGSRTVIVTVVSIGYTAMFAYAFSRKYLRGRRWYAAIGFGSMYFSGGLIPFFILLSWIGLYNSYWVYIFPSIFSFWNVIIFNANFRQIPEALIESAKMDGASEFRVFFQLVLPMSKPVLAALGVFTAVGTWNDYTTTLYFTQSAHLQTLQYFLLKLVQSNTAVTALQALNNPLVSATIHNNSGLTSADTIQLAAMVVASIPMIIIYPFAQRFFTRGLLIGSIKE